jgi:hypothetical protein
MFLLLVVALRHLVRLRRAWRRAPRAWRLAPEAEGRHEATGFQVIDIGPYVARRELVEGAIAVASLAREGTIARHSERHLRSMPASVVDIASRRRGADAAVPGATPAVAALPPDGITVARSTSIPRSDSIEHLA